MLLLGGAMTAARALHAQQPERVRRIGVLNPFPANDAELMGKWLQLLKEVAPSVTRVAVIFNPDTAPFAPWFNRAIEAAAPSFGITITLAPVHDDAGIEAAIATHAREPGGGLI